MKWIEYRNILDEKLGKVISEMKNLNLNFENKQQGGVTHLSELERIDVPTPYNTTTGVHPSILYFPNSFKGYKFWMAFTPYPMVERENPCILASNDGKNFVVPSGLTNPISPTPATGYNSDTDLVYANNKLYCYWRWYTDTGENNILYRMESSDGVTWENEIRCSIPSGLDPLSPTIQVYTNGKWEMWVGGEPIKKLTSTDGVNWTNMVSCTTNLDEVGYHWHIDVWREGYTYYCLSAFRQNEVRPASLMTDLYLGKSTDGVNWTFETAPVLMRGQYDAHHYRVYKSTAVRVGMEHYLYVSGLGKESETIRFMKIKID